MADEDRRRFLKVATCAIGGGVGLAVAAPFVTLLVDPARRITVTTPTDPLDLGLPEQFREGAEPRKVDIVAPSVKDGWMAARNVVLGAAWVRRTEPDKLLALSAICPHLGCSIGWDAGAGNFLCPCHDSRFSLTGDKLTGPSERGMDELPLEVRDGRLQLTWVRFKAGQTTREPA
jgi:menaquinol-cytochrome c reductase iron-sulfur subunit